jgi:hypothetical protein
MKFFIPFAPKPIQAERVYARIAERLRGMGYDVTDERIYKVAYKREGKLMTETIGEIAENGEVVMAIFKDHIGYFICTYSHGVVWGEPLVARYSVTQSIERFDENEPTESDHTASEPV